MLLTNFILLHEYKYPYFHPQMIYPTTRSPSNHTPIMMNLPNTELVKELIETQKHVRGRVLQDATIQTRRCGGKLILVECPAYTVYTSSLKVTKVTVCTLSVLAYYTKNAWLREQQIKIPAPRSQQVQLMLCHGCRRHRSI